jgi:hypothetical protein
MRIIRALLATVAALPVALSASAATCPTAAPPYYQSVAYSGTNCASGLGGTCGIAQPVAFTLSVQSYYGVLEPCDVVTWQFGDGTSATMPPGVFTATHTYAAAGAYSVTTSVSNSLGTQAGLFSPTVVAVANGYMEFYPNNYYPGYSVNEGQSAVVTVQRTSGIGPASVSYATSDNTAAAGQQYTATAGTLTFANGEVQKTFSIPTNNDHVFHVNGTAFTVTLSSPTGGFLISGSTTATVTIIDTDPRPLLSFEAAIYYVFEDEGSITIRVLRGGDLNPGVNVAYSTSGAATVPTNGVLTFLAGETSKPITIPIINDPTWTGTRQIYVGLSSATSGAAIVNPTNATISVFDKQPTPTLTFQSVSVLEGNSGTTNVTLTATLSEPLAFSFQFYPTSINGTARSGIDYTLLTSTVIIPAGQLSGTVTASIIGNTKAEVDKTFQVTTSAYLVYPTLIPVNPGTVTILNDDASVSPAQVSVAKGGTGSILISFGTVPASPQVVTFSSSDPTIASVPGSITTSLVVTPIDIAAKSSGRAIITTVLPAAYGGASFATEVDVFDSAVVVLSPQHVTLPLGGTATITATMSPPLDTSEGAGLKAAGDGAITLPDRVVVDPGGTSSFSITGTRRGTVQLSATLGANRGNAVTYIQVDITAPPTTPTITQVSPANGPAAGGTVVTINGVNLRSNCTVGFGGVPATSVTFVSAVSMTATSPGHAAGAADVALACGSDTFSLANAFTYLASSPTLSGVTPSFGTTAGNTVVAITGANIASGCWPYFDGIAAGGATVTGPTQMIASTPPHAASATVPVTVRCMGAANVSLGDAFTYSSTADSAPIITSVDPLVGSAGKTVTISGARFRHDDAVTFDTTHAYILSTSPGTLVVRIPDLPATRASITVTDLNGHSSTTGPIFTIVEPQPPQIDSIAPASSRPANEVTLNGSGFRPGYSFTMGDVPASLVSMTYTRVVVRVPQLAAGSYAVNVLNSESTVAAVGPSLTVLGAGLAILGVTPACATSDGGIHAIINGTGFATGAVVTFDGIAASGVTVADANTITLTLPPLPTGMPRIVVTNPNNDSAALSNALNVASPFDPQGCSPRPRTGRH